IPVVLIGAGLRGSQAYASYALRRPDDIQVVAVAEPDDKRRQQVADAHNIPPNRCFRSWEQLLDAPLLADIAIVSTPDDLHPALSIGAMMVGYDVLLEIPIAATPQDCMRL